ncbi:hypothetical protein I4U23_002204 [Adineta vaga]|nr:hypothetical protein I4U23_002204 [Adineta vaga]
MSYASRRPAPRPYGSRPRPMIARPVVGVAPGIAIGALGLFACVIAITAYTKQFLDEFKRVEGVSGVGQLETGVVILLASLFYTMFCRIQRS